MSISEGISEGTSGGGTSEGNSNRTWKGTCCQANFQFMSRSVPCHVRSRSGSVLILKSLTRKEDNLFKSILVIYPELQAKRKSELFLDEDEDIKQGM